MVVARPTQSLIKASVFAPWPQFNNTTSSSKKKTLDVSAGVHPYGKIQNFFLDFETTLASLPIVCSIGGSPAI